MENKWTFNSYDDDTWSHDLFDTKEQAIQAAVQYFQEMNTPEENILFYIGRATQEGLVPSIDTNSVLERIGDYMYDEAGEVAFDYLSDVSNEQFHILSKRLNDVLHQWITEFNHQPRFYKIIDVKKYWLVEGQPFTSKDINSEE